MPCVDGGAPPYKGIACKVTRFSPVFCHQEPLRCRFCEIEKDFLRIEKDCALSPPAMRVVRRAFEEGGTAPVASDEIPTALGTPIPSGWEHDSQGLGTRFPRAGNSIPSGWAHRRSINTNMPQCPASSPMSFDVGLSTCRGAGRDAYSWPQ